MRAKRIITYLASLTLLVLTGTNLFASSQPYISGHGINFGVGNKYHAETDFNLPSPAGMPLVHKRTYNSQSTETSVLGYGWTTSLTERLIIDPQVKIILVQPGGRHVHFLYNSTYDSYVNGSGRVRTITSGPAGYKLTESNGDMHLFDTSGKLFSLQDKNLNTINFTYTGTQLTGMNDVTFGRSLTLSYDTNNRLQTLATPIGDFIYTYDANGNLETVTKPDTSTKTYIYDDPNDAHNLTGIIDETDTRTLTLTYDSNDRVTSSAFADGKELMTIGYLPDLQRTVTDSLGVVSTYQLEVKNGIVKVTSFTGPGCSACGSDTGSEYISDDRQNITQVTDAKDNITNYSYDVWGNRNSKTEAVGSAEERTTLWTYVPGYDRIQTISNDSVANPGQQATTSITYDGNGNLQSKTETGYSDATQISRTTDYVFDSNGRIESIDGPRTDVSDVTTFTYYSNAPTEGNNRANLHTVINALGHTTTYSNYNAFGKPCLIDIPYGNDIVLTYDSMGRLDTRTQGTVSTSYEYYADGKLHKINLPETRTITYTYTSTGKPETITDTLNNKITYSYNDRGERTKQEIHDPNNALQYFVEYAYEETGDLDKITQADGSFEDHNYDAVGNLVTKINAVTKTTSYQYDALNRLTAMVEPGTVTTGYGYDSNDNLITVTDAENNQTVYTYDDWGRKTSRQSPDTGPTTYQYDPADNLVASTDSNNITTTYDYDALNRLTAIHYPDSSQDVSYSYDQNNYTGLLTTMQDSTGNTTYEYDSKARLTTESRNQSGNTFSLVYGYNDNNEFTSVTYPSGRVITYNRNDAGQITSVTTTYQGATTTLADNITYKPFGPREDITLGNGMTVDSSYNQLYRLTNTTAGSLYNRSYLYYATGLVQSITDAIDPTASQTFTYDDLGRLDTAQGKYGAYDWTYDNVGNRLTQTLDSNTTSYTYEPNTNKLSQASGSTTTDYIYDTAGNMTNKGNTELVWNQNNRLISALQNANPVGEYGYDGRGLRRFRTVGGETVNSVYDANGNLIAETDDQGNTIQEFAYIEGTKLALFDYTSNPEFTVDVVTSTGRALENVNTYAFNEAGSYAGITSKTDASGSATYNRADFLAGNYTFRADYLGSQFWSSAIDVSSANTVQVLIEEETVQLTVTLDGTIQEGVRVYLFSESGAYLGIYATTDSNGQVSFVLPEGLNYKFRADLLGGQYWSDVVTVQDGGSSVALSTGGGSLTVTLAEGLSLPLPGIKTYLFTGTGSYLGQSVTSDSQGQVTYSVPSGTYKIRADYLGYQFWTDDYVVTALMQADFIISHHDVEVTVTGDMGGDILAHADILVYLFTPAGTYLGVTGTTDVQGKVVFHLPEQPYKVRADHLDEQYWGEINSQETQVVIEEGLAEVAVTNMGMGVEGISVYAFSDTGSYLDLTGLTDSQGIVNFRLPTEDYTFRADYQGNQYWSGNTNILAHQSNAIDVSTGGGSFVMTVLADINQPLVDVKTYLFSSGGAYLGITKTTDNQGEVAYNLADGSYKLRIDYLGYQYWTDLLDIPSTSSLEYLIQHQAVTITAESDYVNDRIPVAGVSVYLFTPSGSYLSQSLTTDSSGQVIFSLPPQEYKVRVDYLGDQYWSATFNQLDTDVTVNDGIAEITLESGGSPAEGVPIYVFTGAGSYLGITATTSVVGQVQFRLPEGSYKFRADYQSNQYWATSDIVGHQINPVSLNAGGGTLSITVKSGESTILVDVPCYLFSFSGSYLGMTARTDANGIVTFDVADGDYKVRADYFNNQFWSGVLSVPTTLSDTVLIDHQDVTVTVNMNDGSAATPLPGTRCYLFTDAGAYTGYFTTTDQNGAATFYVPLNSYKVRADYLGGQYWSQTFDWFDTDIDIAHGDISVHVTDLGSDVVGATVYLFTETGSYLGLNTTTDAYGSALFSVPAKSYKLRVDYDGSQYWTDVVNVIEYQDNPVDMALDLLANNLTNNPHPQRMDGEGPVYTPQVATMGSLVGLMNQVVTQAIPSSDARVYYYISDHLSTAQLLVDDQGAVVWQGNYSPFGGVDIVVNNLENNFRFPGQYFDAETGLHYNWHRYYDPFTGRYLTPDPIGLEGGINLYRYANADPINWFDPDGLHGIIFFGRGPVYINRPNWLRGGRFPRSGELNKPLPQPPKPKANDPCPLEQNNPPMELPKSWWGRLMDKIGSLPGSGGVSAPPLLILEEDPWTT